LTFSLRHDELNRTVSRADSRPETVMKVVIVGADSHQIAACLSETLGDEVVT
jgi:hypothetical protein